MSAMKTDFCVYNDGSIFLLTPLTAAAKEWVAEHLDHDEVQHWGPAVAVEPRYIVDIATFIRDDGLTLGA
jgi:hypothetical protein